MKTQEEFEMSSKVQWGILGVGVVIFMIGLAVGLFNHQGVKTDITALQVQVTTMNNDLEVKRREEQSVRNEVIYKTTGIHPQTVRNDRTIFIDFIEPAFTWTNGAEYDEVRANYVSLLGENSPFLSVYLVENMKVEDYNYVDVNSIKSLYTGAEIYPLEERDGVMDYLGVVEYYLYNKDSDLVGQNQLTTSKAIVKFTVNGEGDQRTVTDVRADAGFVSNVTK